MRAFVTGSTGLLGNNLVRLLIQQGHSVTALVRSQAKAAQLFAGLGNITLVEGDLNDVAGFAPALEGCDTLFHTAAYFREYYQAGEHWPLLKHLNVDATITLLGQAEQRGVQMAIHTSSSGVIGTRTSGAASDESDAPDAYAMENLYFRSKVLAEEEIARFLGRSKLPVVQILPGWMFGPGDAAPTGSGQLVLAFLNRELPGVLPLGGTPVDARDVAQAMINATTRGRSGERYIVGGDTYVPLAELFRLLAQVSGVRAPTMPIPYPLALAFGWLSEQYGRLTGRQMVASVSGIRALRHRRVTSSAKAVRELGATFRPLEQTLRDEVEWFRRHQPERLRTARAATPALR